MPRDMERKRARDLERYHRVKQTGGTRAALTAEQQQLARAREVKRTAWRLAYRHYLRAVAAGPTLIALADVRDPGWRDAT